MVYTEFPPYFAVELAGTSLMALFVSMRAWRDGNVRLVLFLLLDFITVTILPFILAILSPLDFVTIQKLLLSGFLFYLALGVTYFLFTSAARRLLIPFTSLYLLLTVLQLSVRLYYDSYGFGPVLFAYDLMDEITLATLFALFVTALFPLYRQLGSKISIMLDSRHLNNIASSIEVKNGSATDSLSRKNQGVPHENTSGVSLRNAVRLYREGKYGQCIESCDTEVERVMLSKLVELYSTKLDLPMSLQDQISGLESKGTSVPGKDILQLRELRNTLTMSSHEATAYQAKWAVRVARRTTQALANFEDFQPHSVRSQQLQCAGTLP